MLAGRPDASERLQRAAQATYGNAIVAILVERAKALHERRPEHLDTIAQRLTAAGCSYQAHRTDTLAAWPEAD